MTYTIIIPVRFESSRLPGKPLVDIAGKPMVERVWEKALSSRASRVVIGTDDHRIYETCKQFGAETYMTSSSHASGTDRISEVTNILDLNEKELVVNLQGDEPLMPARVIDQVATCLEANPDFELSTLCEPISSLDEYHDQNVVKVILDSNGAALYFTRSPIPEGENNPAPEVSDTIFRHLGIYAYRVGFLKEFTSWPAAPIEKLERLEQLRALYNGARIQVVKACEPVPPGIDTESDLLAIRALLA